MSEEVSYMWTNAKLLIAEGEVDEGAVRAKLPPELQPTKPAKVSLFVADYPTTTFGSVYREAAVLVHCEDDRGEFLHCPWMVVDDDTALILGREVLGFPKKMAEIELDDQSRPMVGTVRRKGGEVMRIEFEPEGEEADPAPVFARRFVNACGTLIHGLDLIEIPAGGERIHRSLEGQGKALPMDGPRDQLAAFRPTGDVKVRYVELDFGGGGDGTPPRIVAKADPAWAGAQFMSRAF